MDRLPADRLAAIRRRCEAALSDPVDIGLWIAANRAFHAKAREDVSDLLDALDAAYAEIDRLGHLIVGFGGVDMGRYLTDRGKPLMAADIAGVYDRLATGREVKIEGEWIVPPEPPEEDELVGEIDLRTYGITGRYEVVRSEPSASGVMVTLRRVAVKRLPDLPVAPTGEDGIE
jgi:hypothetical protein